MENSESPKNSHASQPGGFKGFLTKRLILGVVLTVGILWMVSLLLGSLDQKTPQLASAPKPEAAIADQTAPSKTEHLTATPQPPLVHVMQQAEQPPEPSTHAAAPSHAPEPTELPKPAKATQPEEHQATAPALGSPPGQKPSSSHSVAPDRKPDEPSPKTPVHSAAATEPAQETHKSTPQAEDAHGAPVKTFPVTGMAFVDAVIQPLDYELNHRFWGWRPNDVLDFTDNVNNFQLGVLEVTRRSAIILAERISRTGSTAAFVPSLENGMNWFMIKPGRYWFPSAESKYKDGLDALRDYFHKLEKGEATFYNRTDNLIPLLVVYEDLLGSCDENLVKFTEDDGSPVSFFKADNYFFYAKGIASAMVTILEAVRIDFEEIIDSRQGSEVLHHAIESLHHAVEIDPWLITNSDLSGVFANHRANMAAPISHARFYLGVLITTLST